MGSIPDPDGMAGLRQPTFEEFQRQTSLMTSCTLLWKELSDHFTTLEQDLMKKSEALKHKLRVLDEQTKQSLTVLEKRERTIDGSVEIALKKLEKSRESALSSLEQADSSENCLGEVDDGDGLLMCLKSLCLKMDTKAFWNFVIGKKKELEILREKMPLALVECVDPARFVLESIAQVFPVDKIRGGVGERVGGHQDLGWACVLILESLIPVVVDPVIGKSRLLVTPSVKERAKEIAEAWKASLDERGGIENVKTPDVHTFLQHLVTFEIVKKEDVDFYRKLVVGSAWRKQMPKLAVSLGLGDKMPDIIQELISRGQQLDAVHFTYEVGLVDKFPPVPLLKSFLKDAKKAAGSILEDPNNASKAMGLAARKEQTALKAILKCIEEYKLESQFPPENLKKRLEQLEKVKTDKKRQSATVPPNKRTRANNGGPMPPAKAGRLTNAYVSSFPAAGPAAFVRSAQYHTSPPPPPPPAAYYGNMSPPATGTPYHPYSPEAIGYAPPPHPHPHPMSYPAAAAAYGGGGYGNGVPPPSYRMAYY